MLSLSLQLAAAAGNAPLHWADLGLKTYLFHIDTRWGDFQLRWYSLAYLAGIVFAYWHVSKTLKAPGAPIAQRHADDLFFYCTLGVILGGRLGYATFYTGGETGLPSLWTQPGELIKLWNGGMSFHGELWGKEAGPDVPWAMVFPGGGDVARHPSQLYEALLEGALLAAVMLFLFWKTRARWRPGLLVGTFALGIALARFTVEFFREPDAQLSEFARNTGFSMGQWLTIPLMLVGLFFIVRALRLPAMGSAEVVIPPARDPAPNA